MSSASEGPTTWLVNSWEHVHLQLPSENGRVSEHGLTAEAIGKFLRESKRVVRLREGSEVSVGIGIMKERGELPADLQVLEEKPQRVKPGDRVITFPLASVFRRTPERARFRFDKIPERG